MRKAILLLIPALALACGEAKEVEDEPRSRVISVEEPVRKEDEPKTKNEDKTEKTGEKKSHQGD